MIRLDIPSQGPHSSSPSSALSSSIRDKASSPTDLNIEESPHPIPLYYRIPLLYIEPLCALNGAWLLLSSPLRFISIISPNHYDSLPTILTDQLGSLHLVFAFNLAVVLRATRDVHVWKLMCAGMLVSDVLHVGASVKDMGLDASLRFWGWRSGDWVNFGMLIGMALVRLGLIMGWGLRSSSQRTK